MPWSVLKGGQPETRSRGPLWQVPHFTNRRSPNHLKGSPPKSFNLAGDTVLIGGWPPLLQTTENADVVHSLCWTTIMLYAEVLVLVGPSSNLVISFTPFFLVSPKYLLRWVLIKLVGYSWFESLQLATHVCLQPPIHLQSWAELPKSICWKNQTMTPPASLEKKTSRPCIKSCSGLPVVLWHGIRWPL